ncbi:MAG: glycosyltransferase family 2 protein [Candidatus Gracilibacteria bacterium]|nr:glycosyltransferase family 2 protein [Candidatus Gracilibacteria bacterium]
MKKKLSIIIPFLNEEKTIKQILQKIVNLKNLNLEKEIILVNDGSSDNSKNIINEFISKEYENTSFIYIENETNKGKGYSLKEGFKKSTGDYLIVQDADLEYNPEDYSKIIKKLEQENLDFVYGSRTRGYFENGFRYSYLSFLFGGLVISFLSSLATLKIITDEPTCYKLFKSSLKDLLIVPTENGFEWEPAITVFLIKKGFKYSEVPISYFPRKSSEGKKIKWIDGVKAIQTIIKRRIKKD